MSISLKTSANKIYQFGKLGIKAQAATRDAFRTAATRDIINSVNGKREIPLHCRLLLQEMPDICATLTTFAKSSQSLRACIEGSADALLNLLAADYDNLADGYEDRLLGAGMGQYIFELVAWAHHVGRPLRKPLPFYLQYLDHDPFWASQVDRVVRSPDLMAKVAKNCVIGRTESAAAAFYYLLADPKAAVEQYQPLFNDDMLYAYLSLRSLFERGFTPTHIDYARMSPRWAYHFLMVGTRVDRERCEDAVLKSPSWAIEYAEDAEIYRDGNIGEFCKRMIRGAAVDETPHPLTNLLLGWCEYRTQNPSNS